MVMQSQTTRYLHGPIHETTVTLDKPLQGEWISEYIRVLCGMRPDTTSSTIFGKPACVVQALTSLVKMSVQSRSVECSVDAAKMGPRTRWLIPFMNNVH